MVLHNEKFQDESFPFWFPVKRRESASQVPHLTWVKDLSLKRTF